MPSISSAHDIAETTRRIYEARLVELSALHIPEDFMSVKNVLAASVSATAKQSIPSEVIRKPARRLVGGLHANQLNVGLLFSGSLPWLVQRLHHLRILCGHGDRKASTAKAERRNL